MTAPRKGPIGTTNGATTLPEGGSPQVVADRPSFRGGVDRRPISQQDWFTPADRTLVVKRRNPDGAEFRVADLYYVSNAAAVAALPQILRSLRAMRRGVDQMSVGGAPSQADVDAADELLKLHDRETF